jgi:NAD-dependent SIR2 family protein deacetylase
LCKKGGILIIEVYCNICGKEFEWHPYKNLLQIGEEDYSIELCSDCQSKIIKLIEHLKEEYKKTDKDDLPEHMNPDITSVIGYGR